MRDWRCKAPIAAQNLTVDVTAAIGQKRSLAYPCTDGMGAL